MCAWQNIPIDDITARARAREFSGEFVDGAGERALR